MTSVVIAEAVIPGAIAGENIESGGAGADAALEIAHEAVRAVTSKS